jgi:uncharacterized protein (TIRG00374 family)
MKLPRASTLGRVAVATALTAFILWKCDPAEVWHALIGARLWPLCAAAGLVLADRALMAYRWLLLLRPFSSADGPRFPAVMRIFFVSTFVGTFLPASVGGDAVRAYALAREGVSGASALASVLMDRVLGVLSVLLMAVLGLFLMRRLASNPFIQVSLLVTALGCAAPAVLVFSAPARALATRLLAFAPAGRIQHAVTRLLDAFAQYAPRRADLLNVLGGSIAVQVLRILQAWLLGVALGVPDSLALYFALIPIILLVMLLPITINGIGTSQMGFVGFFGQAGVAYAPAFALSVLFVALGIVGNLPGGVLYLSGGLHGRERNS